MYNGRMPLSDGHPDVTLLMNAAAADRLLPLVYDQLCRAAQQRMATERGDHTLSATALVHEAWLKLVGPRQVPWAGRGHFYAAAAQAMRRILIDHARARAARGGGDLRLEDIGDVGTLASADSAQILAVDAALTRLEADDPEAAAVVRLRFFGGLTVDQAAAALGISPATADRHWAYARAWLYDALRDES